MATTAAQDFFDTPVEVDNEVPEGVQRDQWKRPCIIPEGGGKPIAYTRVSTFSDALSSGGGLVKWMGRMTALGIARREDLAAMASGLRYGDAELDAIIDTAVASASDKAAWGTAVHSFTDPDPSPYVPSRMKDDVTSFWSAMFTHDLECVESEVFVVHDGLQVAGTLDGVYRHPNLGLLVGDKKTGSLKPLALAIQTACYAGAKAYDPATGERRDLGVRQDYALAIHIPNSERRTDIYLVDLERGRKAAIAAAAVRKLRKEERAILAPFNALTVVSLTP